MKANVHGARVGGMTVAATGHVIVKNVMKTESFGKTKDGQMMKSEPFDVDPKVVFNSVRTVMRRMMSNACATGRANVACVMSFETHCDATDGLTENS